MSIWTATLCGSSLRAGTIAERPQTARVADAARAATSSYVGPADDAAELFVAGVVVAPDDVPADQTGLFLVAGVVGTVEGEVPQRGELSGSSQKPTPGPGQLQHRRQQPAHQLTVIGAAHHIKKFKQGRLIQGHHHSAGLAPTPPRLHETTE
jgi:hypothetical protein